MYPKVFITETILPEVIGYCVESECGIWGNVEYVNGSYLGVRGPYNRLDEIEYWRCWFTRT